MLGRSLGQLAMQDAAALAVEESMKLAKRTLQFWGKMAGVGMDVRLVCSFYWSGWTWPKNLQPDPNDHSDRCMRWICHLKTHWGTTQKWSFHTKKVREKRQHSPPVMTLIFVNTFWIMICGSIDSWWNTRCSELPLVHLMHPTHYPTAAPEWIKHSSWFTTVSLWGTQDWWPSRPVSSPAIWYLETSNLYGGYHCQLWSAWIWN